MPAGIGACPTAGLGASNATAKNNLQHAQKKNPKKTKKTLDKMYPMGYNIDTAKNNTPPKKRKKETKTMRYYSTQRPVGPGTYPQQDGTETIINFDGPIYCQEIAKVAWGCIEYREPVAPEVARVYDLTPGGTEGRLIVGTYSDNNLPVAFLV